MWCAFPRRFRALLAAGWLGAASLVAQVSEVPELIGPGKVRFEFDGISLGVDRDKTTGEKLDSVAVGSTLMSLGLSSTLDFQLGIDLYLRQSVSLKGRDDTRSGLGDVTVRAKWLAWEDLPSGQKLAVIPYAKLPSNTGGVGNHAVEGGLLVPWARTMGDTTLGAMGAVNWVRNPADTRYDASWDGGFYVSQELFKPLSVYAELLLSIPAAGLSRWEASGGAGLKLDLTKHLEVEYELVRGFNERATDLRHCLRFDWRW